MNRLPDAEVLLTPREVADLFGVDPKTVTRWAKAGKINFDSHFGWTPSLSQVRGRTTSSKLL